MSDFVHLHLHTEYSLLDGATRISKIADKALSLGQSAVAITDHGVMYGVVEFYNSLKAKGVKPIIGCEVYVAERGRFFKDGKQDISGHHLVLLCKNEEGYKNLCYMVSESFINGFYSRPRIDMQLLKEHSGGIIALSACVAGKIPQLILSGAVNEAERTALEFKEIFGDDFYLEVQNHGLDDERRVSYALKMISEKHSIPLVATNDVHYLDKSDADMQAILMCVQTGNVITDGRPLGFENDEFYFKSKEEMEKLFGGFPDAIENTVKIAEKCSFDFDFSKLHLPNFVLEGDLTHKDKLRIDAMDGFFRKEKEGRFNFDKHSRNEYLDRMEYELSVIDSMGFNAYFLIVSDFVSYAKKSDIPVGPGRGSGAGSLVAFCIGITDVDPMAFDLLFERFLNPERVSMPDFDIDFCYTRREEVIDYVKRKYGEEKVAQIVTFGTLAPRAAVRDVGRALGMPYSKVDSVAKLVSSDSNSIDDALTNRELHDLYITDTEVRRLLDVSRGVEGMPRHASTHAAGVVITEKPTWEYVPLSYSGTGVVTQFDMNTDASLGLVKFDFLGLRYLTVIHDAEREIRKRKSDFSISSIPFDDEKTFRLLSEARTDGVFQLESGGMKQVLSRLCPSCFEDIVACIALFRPGPMDSIDTFIARKHGKEKTVYKTEELADILGVTYGCIVYQEQVMQICRALAGYSYARADIVRRAMSKKKTEAMQAERNAFLDGCRQNGVSESVASEIFDEMVGFAKYAFNKSHATVYGVISYRTAYLKAHYPSEYFAALLSSVLDSSTKLKEYIDDAHKYGVSVLPPDINSSEEDFSVSDGNIRFGLLAIRNVGRQFARSVVNERKRSPFRSFDDFVTRLSESELNKRTLESMIKCGAFDSLGVTRNSLLSCYESILESEQGRRRSNLTGQLDLFSIGSSDGAISNVAYEYPNLPEFKLKELLTLEKESSGMYFSGHLIDSYSDFISRMRCDRISDILASFTDDYSEPMYKDRSSVTVAGIISSKRTKITKNGSSMAFVTLEDRYGEIEVIVFARQYSQYSSLLLEDSAVSVSGNVTFEEGDGVRIILSSVSPLEQNTDSTLQKREDDAKKDDQKRLFIRVGSLSDSRIEKIYRIAQLNRGNAPIALFDERTKKYSLMKGLMISTEERVIGRLAEIFGEGNVILK